MKPLIRPFAGLRPQPRYAAEVAAPPYDVVSTQEARALVAGKPWNFLHVSRPEIDLADGISPYSYEVYARGVANLQHMLEAGVLVRDAEPCYYAYRLTMGEHTQTGLVAAVSVAAYESGRVRRHELTRPDKEDDRVRHIDALNAQTGPVLLAYRQSPRAADLLGQATAQPPVHQLRAADGIGHTLWVVREQELIAALGHAFEAMEALYIADGHHRSAAAARVAANRRTGYAEAGDSHEYFLAVSFPHDEMRILPYNRLVRDLNGLSEAEFLGTVAKIVAIEPFGQPVAPAARGDLGMYLCRQWYRLRLPAHLAGSADPVERLDVQLLARHLLEPVLGIHDPRRDPRIDFAGGVRGLDELERRVNSGEMAVAFAMFPTAIEELMAVADAGRLMPPKSTWFEPKLADGLVSHVLD